jgi:hypothetical protein
VSCPEYVRFTICREMGWTFQEFEEQPIFFIEQIVLFLIQESNKQKADELKYKTNSSKQKGYSRNG